VIRLALTMGDPAGIGPEIVLRAARHLTDPDDSWPDTIALTVYGSQKVLDWTARTLGLPRFDGEVVDVDPEPSADPPATPARPSARTAIIQYEALQSAIRAAQSGAVDAIVTAPWTKHALALAGRPSTGHTEVLAEACGTAEPTMMLCGDRLRVALATTHVALREVPDLLSAERILHHLRTLDRDLRRLFGVDRPRIAVCGVNPHAGEGGVMGDEESRTIGPAIERARQEGIGADGPWPADTLFARAAREDVADAILAMYHDQGLAPLKLWHFGAAANVTLGLPILRASVDHGTAYDIAGRGKADASSLLYALRLAAHMVQTARRAG
jgi:4-hydroxythreonine-4-phosphate dehydrogenase